jgi:hypothetical protein
MAVQNSNFNTLITAIDTKAQSLAASTSDPKDLVYLGKTLEALNVTATVSEIIAAGDTKVTAVNTAGTTQVGLVTAEGTTQINAVNAIAFPTGTTTSVSKTLLNNEHVLVTAAGRTISLPSGTAGGSKVFITVGNFADTIVAPATGQKIQSLAANTTLVLDKVNVTVRMQYHSDAAGWQIF